MEKELIVKHLLGEILNDSSDSDLDLLISSSSDDEVVEKQKRNCVKEYFESVVPTYTDAEFIRHFRISRSLFNKLSGEMEISDDFKKLDASQLIEPGKHLAVFLWFAAHEACAFRDIADRFDLSLSTESLMISRTFS